MPEQLQFAFFASLDFEGVAVLTVDNIAERLGLSVQHVLDEVTEGRLVALDLAGKGATRRYVRVPIEAYRDWVLARLTSPWERAHFLRGLPRATLLELQREIRAALDPISRPAAAPATPARGAAHQPTSTASRALGHQTSSAPTARGGRSGNPRPGPAAAGTL